jgi:hypothetical protein
VNSLDLSIFSAGSHTECKWICCYKYRRRSFFGGPFEFEIYKVRSSKEIKNSEGTLTGTFPYAKQQIIFLIKFKN